MCNCFSFFRTIWEQIPRKGYLCAATAIGIAVLLLSSCSPLSEVLNEIEQQEVEPTRHPILNTETQTSLGNHRIEAQYDNSSMVITPKNCWQINHEVNGQIISEEFEPRDSLDMFTTFSVSTSAAIVITEISLVLDEYLPPPSSDSVEEVSFLELLEEEGAFLLEENDIGSNFLLDSVSISPEFKQTSIDRDAKYQVEPKDDFSFYSKQTFLKPGIYKFHFLINAQDFFGDSYTVHTSQETFAWLIHDGEDVSFSPRSEKWSELSGCSQVENPSIIDATPGVIAPTRNIEWTQSDLENIFIMDLPILFEGERIAFESDGDLRVMKIDGTKVTRLTLDGGNAPTWSPDGKHLSFTSFHPVPAIDGTKITQVTYEGGVNPAWSPDGEKIAFESDRNNDVSQIYTIRVDGTDLEQLTINGGKQPTWSPDSEFIAYSTIDYIYVMRANGSYVRPLDIISSSVCAPTWAGNPAWSPDGNSLAFESKPSCVRGTGISIYILDINNMSVGDPIGLFYRNPSWSPDNTRIAYQADGEIIVKTLNGSETQLTNGPFYSFAPAWSP